MDDSDRISSPRSRRAVWLPLGEAGAKRLMRGRYGTDAVVLGRLPFRRPLAAGRDFPRDGKGIKGSPGDHPSDRSGCFDWKKRSDRTPASMRGPYGNRGCAAREISDDEDPSFRPGGPIAPPLDLPSILSSDDFRLCKEIPSSSWIGTQNEEGMMLSIC